MNHDESKIDDAVLALLLLNENQDGWAWKGMPWDAMDRLHKKGFISNPISKTKSISLSKEGQELAESLFEKLFSKSDLDS
jgi:hypothetical protein